MNVSAKYDFASLGPTCSLGPQPARIRAGDHPILLSFDASMVDQSYQIFPQQASKRHYARLMAMSDPNRPSIIFTTTPLEHQILDSWKEKAKKAATRDDPDSHPDSHNLRNWSKAADGQGMVKQYADIRCRGFVHQYFVMSQAGLEMIDIEDTYSDVRDLKKRVSSRPSCPVADRERIDLRLRSMADNIEKFTLCHPKAVSFTYLRGPRMAARYNELKKANATPWLKSFGLVDTGSNCVSRLFDNLDRIGNTDSTSPLLQPVPYHPVSDSSSSWSKLTELKNGQWLIKPSFEPRHRVPKIIRPLANHVIRIVLDGCVLQDRGDALIDFVSRFSGDIKLVSLPEIDKEMRRGGGAKERRVILAKLMQPQSSMLVKKKDVLAKHRPTFYGDNVAPKAEAGHLTGDLGIRIQVGSVLGHCEDNMQGQKLVFLVVTQDYGCAELLKAIKATKSSVYKVLRIGIEEQGDHFQETLFDPLQPYAVVQ